MRGYFRALFNLTVRLYRRAFDLCPECGSKLQHPFILAGHIFIKGFCGRTSHYLETVSIWDFNTIQYYFHEKAEAEIARLVTILEEQNTWPLSLTRPLQKH